MVITVSFTLLFLSMIGYITYYSVTHKQELINNSYNGRQQMLLSQNRRGSIYSADGKILAQTVTMLLVMRLMDVWVWKLRQITI